ncbi:MAG: DUF1573 domain-containing protein [Gemmataceae bacterium]|nr:DUF1573 domain-containing protein [Gemmataceae bacterium]
MRKAVIALVTLIAAADGAAAQTAWANKLFGNSLTHDFGTVARGARLKHTFTMTNIYKVPLQITHVGVECGCVSAAPTTKLLQPSETAQFHVNMDAARFSGAKTVRIHITVGPEFVSTATLAVSAFARQDVVFNPGEIDFGSVAKGQSPTRFIDVEHAGNAHWRVSEIVKNAAAPFDLKVEQLPQKVSSYVTVGYRIFATVKPNAAPGAFKQEILLKTNDPQASVITFHIGGSIRTSLNVAPNPVNFGSLKAGEAETTRIVVGSGGRPFRIVAIDGLEEGWTMPIPDRSVATHILELRVQPRVAGPLRKQITLRTDLDNEAATVTVEGTVAP